MPTHIGLHEPGYITRTQMHDFLVVSNSPPACQRYPTYPFICINKHWFSTPVAKYLVAENPQGK